MNSHVLLTRLTEKSQKTWVKQIEIKTKILQRQRKPKYRFAAVLKAPVRLCFLQKDAWLIWPP